MIAVVLLLFQAAFKVFILILAGVLVATYFRGISRLIGSRTNWPSWATMTISILGTVLVMAGFFWLIGARVSQQFSQLTEALPQLIDQGKSFIDEHQWAQKVSDWAAKQDVSGKGREFAQRFFSSTFGVLGDLYIIIFISVFFTAAPGLYRKGLVSLVPLKGRDKAKDILAHLGRGLEKWLAGKIFAMVVVAVLTATGLAIIGVPMWLALAILAGILNFVPNFGPVVAAIPAALVALQISPTTSLIVVGMYILIQILESNFITPTVQQRLIQIPPALIIIAQIFVGTFTGFWGLVLATPLVLIVMLLVQDLYIKPMEEASEGSV